MSMYMSGLNIYIHNFTPTTNGIHLREIYIIDDRDDKCTLTSLDPDLNHRSGKIEKLLCEMKQMMKITV